jgi:hydroxyethylthiazole kinase
VKGVDSTHGSMDAVEAAKLLAQTSGAIVAVSGATDIVTDGNQVVGAHNGVALMQKITATGCSVTALIAAFVAVDKNHALDATVSALSVFGVAGELGMKMAKGPASLRMHLIDALYGLDEATLQSHVNITSLG